MVACKGGLFVNQGNDFPCDFNQPEGERDKVCAAGDVCGVDNTCRRYHYEGPQFEGGATEPRFDSAVLLHPGVLSGPVFALTARIDRTGVSGTAVMAGADGGAQLVTVQLGSDTTVQQQPYPKDVADLGAIATPAIEDENAGAWGAAVSNEGNTQRAFVFPTATVSQTSPVRPTGALMPVSDADRLRSGIEKVVLLRSALNPPGGAAGLVTRDAGYVSIEFTETVAVADGGTALLDIHPMEARFIPPQSKELLMLSPLGFFLQRTEGATPQRMSSLDTELPVNLLLGPHFVRPELRSDLGGTCGPSRCRASPAGPPCCRHGGWIAACSAPASCGCGATARPAAPAASRPLRPRSTALRPSRCCAPYPSIRTTSRAARRWRCSASSAALRPTKVRRVPSSRSPPRSRCRR